nr:ABC multidrug transporter [Colletotrichum truncatum]KAF6784469.1 ABC multidrug transporter [Colletotrichum truncatum]
MAITSDVVNFIAGLVMIPLSILEHSRSLRPSILLGIYLLITLIFDLVQLRTLWLSVESDTDYRQAYLSAATVVIKAAALVLESFQKPLAWHLEQKPRSPEETAGIFKLATFSWLNGLFLNGFRNLLTVRDLYLLDEAMTAEVMYAKFEPRLQKNISLGRKHALLRSLLGTLKVPFFLPAVPRLCRIGFLFCQPFLIESLLKYLQEPDGHSSPSKGYGFIGAATLTYVGLAVSQSTYSYLLGRSLFMMRGVLASVVYRYTTTLKLSAADDSTALTLMNTDVERFQIGIGFFHDYWANPTEIAIACWLLQRQIGAAFLAPIGLIAACAAAALLLSKFIIQRQIVWMQAIEKRVAVTSKAISTMKALKISAMTGPVEKSILGLRLRELRDGGRWRTTLGMVVTIAFAPTLLGPVVAFATTSSVLDVARIFTSMAYLVLLASPLGMLLQSFAMFVGSLACAGRIQAYIEKEARVDFRKTFDPKKPAAQHNGALVSDSKATAIKVVQGSFGWEEEKNILEKINLEIPASSLTIIVGPIASGKSTLLKALLGETTFHSGDVIFGANNRSIGYCDQSPFLYNNTVKANIIGHSAFDQERYDQVIKAAMLSADLATLPKGDGTKIGSNGVTLSGGQRQRVALARALYVDTELLLFDDVLSGLDANTEEHVFRSVFGPNGIVRSRGVTAVLCTHSVRHLPSADHIIALGADSTVVEQGTFADLKGNGKYIQSLKVQEAEGAPKETKDTDAPESDPLTRTKTAGSITTDGPDASRRVGDFSVYKYWFGTMSKPVIAAFLFWNCGYGATYAFPTVWLKFWSEDITSPHPTHSWSYYMGIYTLFEFLCLFCLGMAVITCLRPMIFQSGGELHKHALRTLIGAPLRYLTVTDAGTMTGLFAQDITLIDGELPMSFINFCLGFFTSLGMAAVILTSSPWMGISYPLLVGLLILVQMFYLRTSRQLRLLDLETKSPLYSHFMDTLKGLATLRAMGFISADISVNNELVDTSQRPAFHLALIQGWLAFMLRAIVAVIGIAVVTLATQLRANSGYTGASLVTIMLLSDALTMLSAAYTSVETSIGAVTRIKTFQSTVKPESGPEEDVIPKENWPERGAIEIKAVSASYDAPRDAEDAASPNNLALRDLNLTINPGETVAVCGRTGSGKSSLVLLLLRLLDPMPDSTGGITIDSVSVDKVNRDALRKRIIAVSQDPIFLPDGASIRRNLDPSGESDEADCKSVLELVGLLPAVEERGGLDVALTAESFSAGQRQLFCLARAVVRRRVRSRKGAQGGILLLDEVSSSVDRATEIQMHEVIQHEFRRYTVIMVSHRLDTVMDCDTIVVMDKGRVAEKGEPSVLREKRGGMFRELWSKSKTTEE